MTRPAPVSDAAVAVLELLARAAGASGVARRSGPRRARRRLAGATALAAVAVACEIAVGKAVAAPRPRGRRARRHRRAPQRAGRRRGFGHRHLALGRSRLAKRQFAEDRRWRRRRLHAQFDMAQYGGDLLAQADQPLLEQLERLTLVLVERVALRIGAQVDALAQ